MADIIQIEVKFDSENYERPFGLPRTVEVKQGSRVEWVIKDQSVFEEIFHLKPVYIRGFKFTLYFENSSAFQWKSESLLIITNYPSYILDSYPYYPILVASGEAENKGDHKYGLRLVEPYRKAELERPEYDEDPFLTVY